MSHTKDNIGIVAENIVRDREYWNLIKQAADAILSQLIFHCGPNAKTAMIAYPGDPSAAGKFTSDGITIVKQMSFSQEKNPVFEIVRQMAVSVGTEVDGVARDGTTTAMMLFSAVLVELANNQLSENPSTGRELRDDIVVHCQHLRNNLEQLSVSANTDTIRRAVSLSCRGDDQVIEAVMQMIARLPKDFLETYTTYMSGVDKKDGVRISVEENKYPVKAYVTAYGNPEHYMNDDFGVRFEDTTATVIFYNPVRFGHAPARILDGACALIEGIFNQFFLAEDGSPLPTFDQAAVNSFKNSIVIITPYVSDITSYGFKSDKQYVYLGNINNYWTVLDAINAINGALSTNGSRARVMLMSPVGGSRNNDELLLKWLPIAVSSTSEPYTYTMGNVGYIAHNARAHYDGKYLRLGRLYGNNDINPQFTSEFMVERDDDSEYTKIIRSMMNAVRMNDVTMADDHIKAQAASDELTPMLMSMVMASTPRIVITGDVHSELHDQEVVRDAIGSAMSMIGGGVIDMPWYQAEYLLDMDTQWECTSYSDTSPSNKVLLDAIISMNNKVELVSASHPDFITRAAAKADGTRHNVLQLPVPAKGVITTLYKVEEFASQIANSNSIIMSNARINVE